MQTGLLSRDAYVAHTRRLLNTMRDAAPGSIATRDVFIWRQWIHVVETSPDIQPITAHVHSTPAGGIGVTLLQQWRNTHHGFLTGTLLLAVPLDTPRDPDGRHTWRLPHAVRNRLWELGPELWAWHVAREAIMNYELRIMNEGAESHG